MYMLRFYIYMHHASPDTNTLSTSKFFAHLYYYMLFTNT